MKKIIDVSEYQNKKKQIDWEKVKQHIDGAIIRIGYGDDEAGQDDDYVEYNLAECERLGIPFEVYLYSYADSDAHIKSEIAHIKRLLRGRSVRVWLDLEYRPAQKYWRRAAEAFLKAFPDGGIYTWEWVFTDILDSIECPRWICAYGPNDGKPHYGYKPNLDCHGWQYTSRASVPGITGDVDVSEWYGDFAEPPSGPATSPTVRREDIVAQMLAWEGWSEQNGKFRAIIDIYNRYLPEAVKSGTLNYAVKYSDEWCAAAASAAYIAAGAPKIFPIECGCPRTIILAQRMGIWKEADGYIPKPADAVLYDWEDSGSGDNTGTPDHIGIIISVDDAAGTFVVMEGNKDETVGRRTMRVNGRYIRGFVAPKFPEGGPAKTEPAEKKEAEPVAKKNVYEVSGTGTPSKKVVKTGLLKYGQKVTARRQPKVTGEPCSFSPVSPLTRIDVCDTISDDTGKKWDYCCVGGKYGYILNSSIRDYLRVGGLPVATVAQQVIKGDFGNDTEGSSTRSNALKALGYNAQKVQDEVNRILGVKGTVSGWKKVLSVLTGIMAAKDPHQKVIDLLKKHGRTLKASSAWCSETVVAAFLEAGYVSLIGGYAADAPTLKKHAKSLGIWHSGSSGIKAGDIILYGPGEPNHTEIAIDGTYNISGNYNGTVKKRRRAGRTIHGYIRPKYPEDTKEADQGRPKVRFWGIRFWESDPEKYGDASIFLQYGADGKTIEHVLLMDTGMNNTDTIKKLQAAGVKKIDAVLISHDHSDHYGFLATIIEKFEVGHVYFPDQTGVQKYQPEYADRIKKQHAKCTAKKIPVTYLKPGDSFRVGVMECRAIFQADPDKLPSKDDHYFINNMSLVCRIIVDGTWIFHMAGDMQEAAIEQMLAAIPTYQLICDFFKIQWHGDRGAIKAALVKALQALVALSNYHGPRSSGGRNSTYKLLEDAGTIVAANYENGEVYLDMQGGTMKLSCSKGNLTKTWTKPVPPSGAPAYRVCLSTRAKPVKGSGILTIEPEDYTAAEIGALKAAGYKVLGYLSVGSVSDERSYYKSLEKHTLRRLDDWEHERYLDVTSADVQQWAIRQGKKIIEKGCDGLWIDNLDVYEEYPSENAYKGITKILQSLYASGYIMVNGGIAYMMKAMQEGLKVANGITQEEVFSRITDYDSPGDFGTQTAKQSAEYQKYIALALSRYMDAFLLEYTRDAAVKKKILDYCKASGVGYYISEDVDL